MAGSGHIAVVGVGNEFRHDDGIGCIAVTRLEERARHSPLPAGTVVSRCDGDPGRLIGLWEGADLAIVIDAAHAHPGRPGKVHRVELADRPVGSGGATSSHSLGLGEAVELARALDRLPRRLVVYAVEGADQRMGIGLSPPVAAAVEPLVRCIEDDIARHRDEHLGESAAAGPGR
ncbi:hydrogenase maturation protease [Streptomyces sp. NPDC018031]|uniref:hydrogenase maturation protease n=1 Tax=Streptomyces sp. NPDC018031 TaxID=3365033 RepID=UPI0037B025C9